VEVPHWEALPAAVSPWFGEHSIGSVITGAVPELEPLREHLAAELGVSLHGYTKSAEAQLEDLFSLDCGITTVRAGIAETGSLLLIPDALQPRLLSLAPPVHLALVERRTLYPTLGHYLATDEDRADPPTNLVLISGASRTADIELTLSIGVHGPKVLLVALIG
jgi:L-lactate dehydrogenase complex protein LldG